MLQVLKFKFLDPEVSSFFRSVVRNNIEKREKEQIIRHDLIHLLMEARKGRLKHEDSDDKHAGFATVEESQIGKSAQQMILTDDDVVAQAVLFFFAGFDTISTVLSFLAYELAVNPDVQKKLQKEINDVVNASQGKVSYDTLLSMKYLDQVISGK